MKFRESKPGKIQIINFELGLSEGFRRGVVAVFDVSFPGTGHTICNLTLEYSRDEGRDAELVVGYPASPIRRRAPKHRQQMRLGMTPELEQEILTLANYEIPKARRKAIRSSQSRQDDAKSASELTLPTQAEQERDGGGDE